MWCGPPQCFGHTEGGGEGQGLSQASPHAAAFVLCQLVAGSWRCRECDCRTALLLHSTQTATEIRLCFDCLCFAKLVRDHAN